MKVANLKWLALKSNEYNPIRESDENKFALQFNCIQKTNDQLLENNSKFLKRIAKIKKKIEEKNQNPDDTYAQSQKIIVEKNDIILKLLKEKNSMISKSLVEKNEEIQKISKEKKILFLQGEDLKSKIDFEVKEKEKFRKYFESLNGKVEIFEKENEKLRYYRDIQEKDVNSKQKLIDEYSGKLKESMKRLSNLHKEKERGKKNEENLGSVLSQLSQFQSECFLQKKKIKNLEESLAEVKKMKQIEEKNRRLIHNQLMDLKANIRVFLRVRPVVKSIDKEFSTDHLVFLKNFQKIQIVQEEKNVMGERKRTKLHNFKFDEVFSPQSSQEEVFKEVSLLVNSAIFGETISTIIAYGPTNSGKTYTMTGFDIKTKGILPRSIEQIFNSIKSLEYSKWEFKIFVNCVEIYNNTLRDLLLVDGERKKKLEIKHCKNETLIENVKEFEVKNSKQTNHYLKIANRSKIIASTNCNNRSSRSHCIFTIKIVGRHRISKKTTKGIVKLVDLAGSERLKVSKSKGERKEEVKYINSSLSSLSHVMTVLFQKKTKKKSNVHVPLRNSKLTFLLKKSFEKKAKTLM